MFKRVSMRFRLLPEISSYDGNVNNGIPTSLDFVHLRVEEEQPKSSIDKMTTNDDLSPEPNAVEAVGSAPEVPSEPIQKDEPVEESAPAPEAECEKVEAAPAEPEAAPEAVPEQAISAPTSIPGEPDSEPAPVEASDPAAAPEGGETAAAPAESSTAAATAEPAPAMKDSTEPPALPAGWDERTSRSTGKNRLLYRHTIYNQISPLGD